MGQKSTHNNYNNNSNSEHRKRNYSVGYEKGFLLYGGECMLKSSSVQNFLFELLMLAMRSAARINATLWFH